LTVLQTIALALKAQGSSQADTSVDTGHYLSFTGEGSSGGSTFLTYNAPFTLTARGESQSSVEGVRFLQIPAGNFTGFGGSSSTLSLTSPAFAQSTPPVWVSFEDGTTLPYLGSSLVFGLSFDLETIASVTTDATIVSVQMNQVTFSVPGPGEYGFLLVGTSGQKYYRTLSFVEENSAPSYVLTPQNLGYYNYVVDVSTMLSGVEDSIISVSTGIILSSTTVGVALTTRTPELKLVITTALGRTLEFDVLCPQY
jgi:hypothetical protein